jgi:phytanoyl-CoA hydroxylase
MWGDGEARRYADEGYVVFPGAIDVGAVEAARADLSAIVARAQGELARGERDEPGFWELLRRSADRVEVFRDPGAPFDPREPGALEGATMRVGHALHRGEGALADLCRAPALRDRLRGALGEAGEIVTAAVIWKQPRTSVVQFGLHQDAWYLTTEPETLHLAFVALDDMDAESGTLEVVPGSHLGAGVDAVQAVGPRGFVTVAGEAKERGRDRAVLLPMARGTLVLVQGRCYHGSGPNRSDRPRRALVVHAKAARSAMHPASWVLRDGVAPAFAAV